jgi:transketolase
MNITQLKKKSLEYRKIIIEIIYNSNAGHTAGSLSCIDIINVLYNDILDITPDNFNSYDRNRYIQSKGHSVEALYTVLCDKGFFKKKDMDTLNNFDSHFIGHPTRKVNGIEHNSGALGHGLSVAVGMALAYKMEAKPFKVFALLGDGELSEGSIWEACTTASKYQLDNLVVIIDRNNLQISGDTELINPIEPLDKKFEAFGFSVKKINGHDVASLKENLNAKPMSENKPSVFIANTIKGKGISFMENIVSWHHRVPTKNEYKLAIDELKLEIDKNNG